MKIHDVIHGFAVQSAYELPEIGATLWEMTYSSNGARLVWLERDDENKTFGIAFRTIPSDDTGVFHILEHSVLCGSENYPIKEPFVELMKSSMNTFLNAMTFPDKTFYPVSSRNSKDFINLLRVYMDAVLHPLIYSKPEIFCQEGWHYELEDNGNISYKGVVLSEMKGAFASPDTIIQNEMFRLLFPNTPYRYISGGDPAHIPELTYEQFVESHRQFYHPSNAYIILDGRIDLDEVLRILDVEYLSAYSRKNVQAAISMQSPVKRKPTSVYYEISPEKPLEGRTWLAWGNVLGDYRNRKKQIAFRVLIDVLCGSNRAPLKKRILTASLAQDIQINMMGSIQQPFAILTVKNMDINRCSEVQNAVLDELRRLQSEGLDHTQLEASLANLEFQMRERDYGNMPRGVGFSMNILDSWIYGGAPAANLELGEVFAALKQDMTNGYFELLLEQLFLDNPHSCQVTLFPSHSIGEEIRSAEIARLHNIQNNWSLKDIAALQRQQKALTIWQSSKDSPEAIKAMPTLQLSDISAKPVHIPIAECSLSGCLMLKHNIFIDGISYINLYFDISDFSQTELSTASFLCHLLGNLNTTAHSSAELQRLQRLALGNLSFNVETYGSVNKPEICRTFLCISFSTLDSRLEDSASLVAEIITESSFDDQCVIREYLIQSIAGMEQSVIGNGPFFAMTRIAAGYSAEGVAREYTGGFAYYQWLRALEKNFKSSAITLAQDLKALYQTIFVKNRLIVSITGTNNHADRIMDACLVSDLPSLSKAEFACSFQPWGVRQDGIIIPADTSFAVLGGNHLRKGSVCSGTMRVLSRIVSLDYLWNTIRVQGGAYGTGMVLSDSGDAFFYSYRDPNAARSITCYRQTANFINKFCGMNPDLTGFIVGSVAESDRLMLPQKQGKVSDVFYLKGISYAERCNIRRDMLAATPEELLNAAQILQEIADSGSICVIGSQRQIEACGKELDNIYTL